MSMHDDPVKRACSGDQSISIFGIDNFVNHGVDDLIVNASNIETAFGLGCTRRPQIALINAWCLPHDKAPGGDIEVKIFHPTLILG